MGLGLVSEEGDVAQEAGDSGHFGGLGSLLASFATGSVRFIRRWLVLFEAAYFGRVSEGDVLVDVDAMHVLQRTLHSSLKFVPRLGCWHIPTL